MQDKRDDYEPIFATRPSRAPVQEDAQPIWQIALAIVGVLVLIVALAWWWMSKRPSESEPTSEQGQSSSTEMPAVTEEVQQQIAPPARDPRPREEPVQPPAAQPAEPQLAAPQSETVSHPGEDTEASSDQPSVLEGAPENSPEAEAPPATAAPPASVSVRFVSPDPQVRLELHRMLDSSPPLLIKAGDVVPLAAGPYRVVASGTQLERFEQEVTFDGEVPVVYMVELCAERTREQGSLAGQVVEERTCGSTPECESMFMVLSEYADELVRDREFRTQQCGKWRNGAVPDGSWTLNINCGGATLATTCRVEIAEGACTFAGPRRTARGTSCPRAELK